MASCISPPGIGGSSVAADPGTGETLWVHRYAEPTDRTAGVRKNKRGVAYWSDGHQARILTITPGYGLIGARRQDGHPDVAFGTRTSSL